MIYSRHRPIRLPARRASVLEVLECGRPSAAFCRVRFLSGSISAPIASLRFQCLILVVAILSTLPLRAARDIYEERTKTLPGYVLQKEGSVFHQQQQNAEAPARDREPVNVGDTLRTEFRSRALVALLDKNTVRLAEKTRLKILAPSGARDLPTVYMSEGRLYYVNRNNVTNQIAFATPNVNGTLKGTEFLVEVEPGTGETTVTMFDGMVSLHNDATPQTVSVHSGEQAIAAAGKPIVVQSILKAKNIVQWWLYYPAVLDPQELNLSPAEQTQLSASLAAYRSGNLPEAFKQYPGYPTPAAPTSDPSRIYYAALLLSVGSVADAQAQLDQVDSNAPLGRALQTLIDSVAGEASRSELAIRDSQFTNSSQLLALSYTQQSTRDLPGALAAARSAVERSPRFGFAWARVAELEFSFAHTRLAREAIQKAIQFTPSNAQAHALNGFLLAAENHFRDALKEFDLAVQIDPALANAWLGRALVKRRLTSLFAKSEPPNSALFTHNSALADFTTAAALEPGRSLLRSYAAKAFADAGLDDLAQKELDYAKKLDSNDPTPWLYSALLNREQNRINPGVDDLERSIALNDNRAVYRSRFLLDEDRAVRSSSLANLYQTAGMNEVALREAARAVSYDYANYSAHQFLSESYNLLRDPTRFNLRYETVWFNELLLANLLSPVGATPLSQHISQQEYTRLFEQNRSGLSMDRSYRSDGQFREIDAQFGNIGNTAWSIDLDCQYNKGVRPNNKLDRLEAYATIKQQLTPKDSILILAKYQDYHSGDNFQYYDWRTSVRTNFTFDEYQHPIAIAGYHHEWSPGIHTLLLGGRLENDQRFRDRSVPQIILLEDPTGAPVSRDSTSVDVSYRSRLEIYSAEANQICDWNYLTVSAGARYQSGRFRTENLLDNPSRVPFLLENPPAANSADDGFERITGYGYLTLKPWRQLELIGGLAYDHETIPSNFRHPPITTGIESRSHVGPKVALVWSSRPEATVRGIYTRSLGGVSLDESYRLEPAQLAGFPESFRTLIPESTPGVGSVSAPEYESFGLALDLKLGSRTYAGFQVERILSSVHRRIGVFTARDGTIPAMTDSIAESLEFKEHSLLVRVDQLLGEHFVVGARYKLTHAELQDTYPGTLGSILTPATPSQRAMLYQGTSYLLFNHSSGFFAGVEAQWYAQHNHSSTLPDDSFVQENLYLGYRLPHQKGDLTIGLLNIGDQNYNLNPLNSHEELPHERLLLARLRLRF